MKLHALAKHVARAGEHAASGARDEYLASLEGLQEPHETIPGNPRRASLTPLSTMMPTRLQIRHKAALSVDKDGDVDADLSYDLDQKRGWWRRPKHGTVADIEIEWSAHEPPEAICRIRDVDDDKLEHNLRRQKWVETDQGATRQATDASCRTSANEVQSETTGKVEANGRSARAGRPPIMAAAHVLREQKSLPGRDWLLLPCRGPRPRILSHGRGLELVSYHCGGNDRDYEQDRRNRVGRETHNE